MGTQLQDVTKNLIIINVLFFIATFLGQQMNVDMYTHLGLFYFDSPLFKPWQVITHMFMHGGLFHIFFNMFALFMFGNILERVWGPQRFLFFYFATGLGAVFIHTAFTAFLVYQEAGAIMVPESVAAANETLRMLYTTPTVGASGAVYGLFIAFALLFPNTPLYLMFIPIPIKAKYMVIGLTVLSLVMGFGRFGDNIAHFAHLGGMLFGFIIVRAWQKDRNRFY